MPAAPATPRLAHPPAARRPVRGAGAARRAAGLSLAELCMVLAVLAAVLAVAVPGLEGLIERRRLHGGAALLAADLHWVRSEARARGEALRFSVLAGPDGQCTLVHTGTREACRCPEAGRLPGCDGGAVALVARHWPARDRIRVEANVGSMLYDPVQGTTSPAGRLQVLDSRGQGITHVVNLSGRLRSCSPQAAVPGYRSC
ncbi:GspH/FimT family protein [Piscinibacter sakaiensis]|nr:GspH/FimT family pseudopilin [Piscinibacter sakaiensis]